MCVCLQLAGEVFLFCALDNLAEGERGGGDWVVPSCNADR